MRHRPRMSDAMLAFTVLLTVALGPFHLGAQNDGASSAGLIERVRALEGKMNQVSHDFGIGTVIFSLNNQPPGENWKACDGEAEFPTEPSVPESLRGKKVPMMQDALVAVGPSTGSRVEGALAVQNVGGDKFSLPATTPKRIAEGKGNATNPVFRGGMVCVMTANANYLNVHFGAAGWSCFGGKMDPEPAIFEYHPAGTKIQGSFDVKPPTHVFLRAYVRIR